MACEGRPLRLYVLLLSLIHIFPPEFLQMNLPVFLFQPLVENSVEHGFSNKKNECYISISCQLENELLHFLVADNGSGMSPEQLKVLQDCNKTSPKGHHSIGLANVNQRLRSYYGEEYGLLVDSIPGEGLSLIHI